MVTTLHPSGLGTRFAGPARLLASRLAGLRRSRPVPPDIPVPVADLKSRIHVPILARAQEMDLWDQTIATYATMAEDQRWGTVLADLHAADQNRSVTYGRRRLAGLISKGARRALTVALTAARSTGNWPAAETEIARIAAVHAAHSQDYGAAHLLAQAHFDYGWARRCAASDLRADVPRDVWQAFLTHTALAEAALDPFDPLEESSPLLAGTRYLLVRGLEEGEDLFRDWYEDWSDLDPANLEPHSIHAPHLLPHWFGTLSQFDAEARAALRRTQSHTGAAAYAVFYLAATDALGDLPPGLDVPLFLQGLQDFQSATGCQYRANIVVAALADLDHALSQDFNGSRRHQEVRKALDTHLRGTLREFHLATWNRDEALVRYALAQVFAVELAQGADIVAGPNGLVAQGPRQIVN